MEINPLSSLIQSRLVDVVSILFDKQEHWRVEKGAVVKDVPCNVNPSLMEIVFDAELVYAIVLPEGQILINKLPNYLNYVEP